jgi:carbon-monoxide dehydrogenase large subunit
LNPLGAKGVGELGTVPAAPAVIAAVEDALNPFNIKIAQTPIMPHTLLAMIAEGQAAQGGASTRPVQ